jgi:hypothetical protein
VNALEVLVFVAGAFIALATVGSTIRTVILPRGVPVRLTRTVFRAMRILFELRIGRRASYERRDQIMAFYAPLTLLVLLLVWLTLVFSGYTLMFWGIDVGVDWQEALTVSGSALLTLGLVHPESLSATIISFTEAAFGLILLTLLIAYLPTLYSVFSRREAAVETLEARAGAPPSAVEMLERFWRIEYFHGVDDLWERWEGWFIEVAETHTSFPALVFLRSPEPDHSWVTAAGTVLDGASLTVSCVDRRREPRAELMIRAGYLALRRIATYFGVGYDPDPKPDDPISISRREFDEAWDRLSEAGLPMKKDRDRAWEAFAGWRVNYDTVLLELARLVQAPPAPWTSDRSAVVGKHKHRRLLPMHVSWASPLPGQDRTSVTGDGARTRGRGRARRGSRAKRS